PRDLLNLSRVSKAFARMLLSKQASPTWIWRDSLRQISGLPECPVGLTLPRYVNLVFVPRCHVRSLFSSNRLPTDIDSAQFCLKRRVHQIFWELHFRCCARCMPKQ
ncbi:hypothetical protein PLICRDRAFT_106564, partial [Plicaturopsis crispa FD-325 SS-3]